MTLPQQLAKVARDVAESHRRRAWRYVASGVWLRADKAETFRRIRGRGSR